MDNYSYRLKKLRDECSLSQKSLENYIGIRQTTYFNVENGISKTVNPVLFIKLSLLYNVSLDYLLGITNIRNPLSIETKKYIIKNYSIDIQELNKLNKMKKEYNLKIRKRSN